MRLRQMFLSLALISLSFSLPSCSEDSEKSAETTRLPEIEELIRSVQAVETDFARGFLLRSATPRVQSEFQDNLYRIRAAAYLLRDNPRDQVGLMQLHASYKVNESLNLIQDDRTLLEDFIAKLRATLDSLTSMQGIALDGFGDERLRTLFTHNFNLANDLGDFRAFTAAGNRAQTWKVTSCGPRCGNLEYLIAQVEKAGEDTWLLSPRMALPDREEISLTLEGSSRGPLVDVWAQENRRRFRVLVSEINSGGSPQDADQWQDITDALINFPGGKYAAQFRSFKIETDLARFRGKSVVIALRLAATDSLQIPERPETQWQINKFVLQGKGQLELLPFAAPSSAPAGSLTPPAAPVATGRTPATEATLSEACGGAAAEKIAQPSIESLSIQGEAPFVQKLTDREPKFIKFSGRLKEGDAMVNKVGTAWVLSEAIAIKGRDKLCLSLETAVWFGKAEKDQVAVFVSGDYKGDPEAATWSRVALPANLFKTDRVPGGASLISFKGLELSSLLVGQENVVIGLRYMSDAETAPWWGVKGIEVTGLKSAE